VNTRRLIIVLIGTLIALTSINLALFVMRDRGTAGPAQPPDGPPVRDFALLDQEGRFHHLTRMSDASAIVLYVHGVGCPIVRQTAPAFKALRSNFEERGVVFLMINANPQDSRESIAADARTLGIDVPILKDTTQLVTGQLGVHRTGEAFVIDPATWRVRFHGPVDDRLYYEAQKPAAERHYLRDAIEAHLSGRPMPGDVPSGLGCLISRLDGAAQDISYSRDVAPILRAKCIPCHRPGGAGPWSMDRHETVWGWSAMMREVLMTRRMPPWHADPAFGAFSPDRSLSIEQARTLVHWIDAGSPRGAGPDPLAEDPPAPAPEWPLGEPDLVIDVPEQSIPAQGAIEYRYVTIPIALDRDAWVRAVDLRPSNTAAMHHAFAFLQYPERLRDRQPDWGEGIESFFAGYVPGYDVLPFPDDAGQLVPAGSSFLLQLHYTALGHDTSDRPRIGLYFHAEPPARELVTASAPNVDIVIPPGDPDYRTAASAYLDRDVELVALFPHMHYRGSWMRYEARLPGGERRILLSVPNYRFNWQSLYRLREPLPLPRGTTIFVTGGFDNSQGNPFNPDHAKEVRWGLQSWEEMFIGYFQYTAPRTAVP
jgi:peroxiredoxin